MVGESYFVAFTRGIDHEVVVEVEQEAAHVLVVDLTASIRLVLGDYLATVLVDEIVLLARLLHEDAPPRHVRRRQQQMLAQPPLDAAVLAQDFVVIQLICATGEAEIGVTLPDGQEARTLLRVTLSLAPAPGKTVLAFWAAVAEFLAEVLSVDALARLVAALPWVVAWHIVIHMIRRIVTFHLDFAEVHGPEAVAFLLVCAFRHLLFLLQCMLGDRRGVLLHELVHLSARLRLDQLGDGAAVGVEDVMQHSEQRLLRPRPLLADWSIRRWPDLREVYAELAAAVLTTRAHSRADSIPFPLSGEATRW